MFNAFAKKKTFLNISLFLKFDVKHNNFQRYYNEMRRNMKENIFCFETQQPTSKIKSRKVLIKRMTWCWHDNWKNLMKFTPQCATPHHTGNWMTLKLNIAKALLIPMMMTTSSLKYFNLWRRKKEETCTHVCNICINVQQQLDLNRTFSFVFSRANICTFTSAKKNKHNFSTF